MQTLPLNTSRQIVSLIYWHAGEWFWRDESCEEMGPFETRTEAADHYRAVRFGMASTGATND